MNILEELKISKKQNKNERYVYLCSQFNAIDYCIRLEKYTNKLQQENEKLKADYGTKVQVERDLLKEENKQLKDKLSKIETLIINHNCDTGDIYYKYNSKFLKSELKQRILEIVYEQGSDSNGQ